MEKEVVRIQREKVRDPLWLEHFRAGFKEGAHGGDKRAQRRRERHAAKVVCEEDL